VQDAVPLAPNFDTAGWFTRSADDMLTVYEALVRPADAVRTPHGCYLEMSGIDSDVAEAFRAAASGFAEPVDERLRRELVNAFSPAAEVYGVLGGHETWRIHRKWAERYRARYGPLVVDRLERARAVSPAQLAAVEPSLQSIRRALARYFLGHDFLIIPATPFVAPAKAELTPANRLRMLGLTAPASLGGLPVLTIPVALPSGLSTGLQIVFRNPQDPVVAWALEACSHSSD
jgi:amidase/aspartyl-tRNA(Asn)/glutamyl-tRNA(Gln) amidotransferase subunit A